MDTATADRQSSPYHGSGERAARLQAGTGLVAFSIALLLRWWSVWVAFEHHHATWFAGVKAAGELRPFRVFMLDALACSIAFTLVHLFRSLGQRIALGGSEAKFLHRLRAQVASVCMGGGLLFLFLLAP